MLVFINSLTALTPSSPILHSVCWSIVSQLFSSFVFSKPLKYSVCNVVFVFSASHRGINPVSVIPLSIHIYKKIKSPTITLFLILANHNLNQVQSLKYYLLSSYKIL